MKINHSKPEHPSGNFKKGGVNVNTFLRKVEKEF